MLVLIHITALLNHQDQGIPLREVEVLRGVGDDIGQENQAVVVWNLWLDLHEFLRLRLQAHQLRGNWSISQAFDLF